MTRIPRSELRPQEVDVPDSEGRLPMIYVVELRRGEVRGTSAPALVLLDLRTLVRYDRVAQTAVASVTRIRGTHAGRTTARLRSRDELLGVRPQVETPDLAGILALALRVLRTRCRSAQSGYTHG